MLGSYVSALDNRLGVYRGSGVGPDGASWSPYMLTDNAAAYSLSSGASDSTYLIDGSNRLYYVADRSGNSAVNGLIFPGVASNGGTLEAKNYALPDLDVQCEVASNTYAADEVLVERDNDASVARVFLFRITAAGLLRLLWWPTGASASQVAQNSTAAITTRVSAFGKIWARATLDTNNGAGGYDLKFWTSTDGATWSQLGDTIVGGSTTSLFTTSSIVSFGGGRTGGSPIQSNLLSGIVYRARAYATIDGSTPVFDVNFTTTAKLATSFTDTSANAAAGTVLQTSVSLPARIHGARDLYQHLAASMPTFSVSGGRNIATFDGGADFLKSASFSYANGNSNYHTISQVGWTSGDAICDGNTANTLRIAQTTSTPEISLSAGSVACANTGLAVGVRAVVSAIFNGASSRLGINLGTAATGNAGAGNANGFTLGARDDGAAPANITWSQSLLRSVADDTSVSARIINYFMRVGGIS
jgi:hypothetical protein